MSQPEAPAADDALPENLTLTQILDNDQTTDFAESSQLTYLIPSETDLDLDKVTQNLEPGKSILDVVHCRESLFFDETTDVLLVLKTPWSDESAFRLELKRLVISLEVQIANGNSAGRDSPPASEAIFTGSVPQNQDPFIFLNEDEGDGQGERGPSLYAAWKLPVFLARPHIRLHNPSAVLVATASLKPDVPAGLQQIRGNGYLQSGVPSGFNLLESFGNDTALDGTKPRLSALRVSRVTPVTQAQDELKHIRALPQLALKIHPVVHARIRFSRPNTAPSSNAVIALLEVDFTSHFDCEVLLESINLSIRDGSVECLNDDAGMELPQNCVAHDHVTFLYRIVPLEAEITPKNPGRDLDISIKAAAQMDPGKCTPQLSMHWTTHLDFTAPVNPGFGPASGAGIQRSHRPSQLSITGHNIHPLKSPSAIRPDALPTLEASTNEIEADLPELGITMTFSAPTEPVHPGDVFCWTVSVVNRPNDKNQMPARKLALVAMPKRRRGEVRMARPPSTGGRRSNKDTADGFMDENVLHAVQKNSMVDSTDVVCLSADTRIGPLAPGACHVVQLQFLALQEGIVGVDAIRVIDMGSQEHVDIRELPTMIIEPAAA